MLAELPIREPQHHKGNFGRLLIVGGSTGMSGSVGLAGQAALRSGAGLVTVGVPRSILPIVAGYEPSYMTLPLAEDDDTGRLRASAWEQIEAFAAGCQCVACGPGLGRSRGVESLVARMYTHLALPMVVDADGLNALAARPRGLEGAAGPRVLTPHPGEFRRLAGKPDLTPEQARDVAPRWAQQLGVVLVMKGHRTQVHDRGGRFENTTGNPGMATGGTGDVLTGILGGFLAQGMEPFRAACTAVHLHGLSGDLAARELGMASLIASDLIRFLPTAMREYSHGA